MHLLSMRRMTQNLVFSLLCLSLLVVHKSESFLLLRRHHRYHSRRHSSISSNVCSKRPETVLFSSSSDEVVNLYDMLGAHPKDTQVVLKRRYQALARQLHPDANVNVNANATAATPATFTSNNNFSLSEINAAWQILSDPRERLRYDRQLQAKELADNIETMVGRGLQTAIPFLRKTANSTAAAVDLSSKAAQRAYGVFELEQKRRTFEQKAEMERARMKKLQKELQSTSSKSAANSLLSRRQEKEPNSVSDTLTFKEAQRLLNTFNVAAPPSALVHDLKMLQISEQQQQALAREQQTTTQMAEAAQREVNQATQAEQLAQQRLWEAQRALQQAQEAKVRADIAKSRAVKAQQAAAAELEQQTSQWFSSREKVRLELVQQQGKYVERRQQELQQEIQRLEKSAQRFQKEAQRVQREAQDFVKNPMDGGRNNSPQQNS